MKRKNLAILRRLFIWLTVITMLMGTGISGVWAAPSTGGVIAGDPSMEGTLTPPDYSYEDGNVILHKQAERIGPDEWKVNVKVTVGSTPVEKRKLEVVFVLDCSGSMAWCADESHALGSHTHSDSCKRVYTCTKEEHTHSFNSYYPGSTVCGTRCTYQLNPSHWTGYQYNRQHISGTTCVQSGNNYYVLTCGKEEHTHDNTCYTTSDTYQCGRVRCVHSGSGSGNAQCYYYDENGNMVYYKTRLEWAKEAINTIASNLTKDGSDNIVIKYVIFSSASSSYDNGVDKPSNSSTMVVGSINNVIAEGGTQMYHGIETGIAQFSNNDYKKVLVVLTDGEANDDPDDAPSLNSFKTTEDGTVFTIGFAYANSVLAGIAGNGGSYMHAANADSLKVAFESLEQSLTAMLEDPMGASVGFTADSLHIDSAAGGQFTDGEVIYWHPASDGHSSIKDSTIEYSYTVKLDYAAAQVGVGEHPNVPLNEPTYFKYGIEGEDNATDMKSAAFPIPIAEYAFSSITTTWQTTDGTMLSVTDLENAKEIGQTINLPKNPTDVEKVISDYSSASYTPHYEQSYDYAPLIVLISGSNDYYRYIRTTVTADGVKLDSVDEVDATQPVAYKVVHEYELVKANELYVSGTKIMNGRDFDKDDSFSFVLTPVSPADAPLPQDGKLTITPTLPAAGSSVVFTFDKIVFTEAGVYTYTIHEQDPGDTGNEIYDTVPRTMVVEVVENNGVLTANVTYSLNGEAVNAVTIVNSLETGTLKVEKTGVDSYNEAHQNTEFSFVVNVKNQSNRPLSGTYQVEYSDGRAENVTFVNGFATVKLKAGQSVVINGLPDKATYTVTEDKLGGFTATETGDTGKIAANGQRVASFHNAYAAKSQYQFIGTKVLEGAELRQDQFTFYVMDEEGKTYQCTNNADGSIFFPMMDFTHEDIGTKLYEDIGTKLYYIGEVIGNEENILYDRKVYQVTLTITDKGDGTLGIVSDLPNNQLVFTNKYITGQLNISKTVSGNMGNRYAKFPFTLTAKDLAGQTLNVSTDGGATFTTVTLDENGQTTFTLAHGQDIIFYPVTGAYTVTETANGSYTTTYSIDGGNAESGTAASGTISADGSASVAFNNHLEMSPPTGVDTPTSAALVGIVMAMALLAIVYIGRRWRILEE